MTHSLKFLKGAKSRMIAASLALVGAMVLSLSVAAPAQAYYTNSQRDFEVSTHIQGIGWSTSPGTRGEGRRIEAIKVTQLNDKVVCLAAHVSTIGWQSGKCTNGRFSSITIGTTGRSLAIEAVEVWRPRNAYAISARVHIQRLGDDGVSVSKGVGGFVVGTTGRGLRLERFELSNL